jgi:hypothetical protein
MDTSRRPWVLASGGAWGAVPPGRIGVSRDLIPFLPRGAPAADFHSLESWTSTSRPRTTCTAHRPISARLEPASRLRSVQHWFAHAAPSDLARQARAVWQCQHVPPSSGPLATLPGVPRLRLGPQLHQAAATTQRMRSHHLPTHTAPRGAQLRREETCSRLQDVIGAAQLSVLTLQRFNSATSSLVGPGRRPSSAST